MIVLLDTNILIGLINGRFDPTVILSGIEARISVVSVTELFALPGMSDAELLAVEQIADTVAAFSVDRKIAILAGRIARTRRRGTADLLIAATAIAHGIPLMTENRKDFRSIPGLELK